MDGNGRWASDQGMPRYCGHRAGAKALRRIMRVCADLGIPYLTVFAFSTENWRRPQDEVDALMTLIIEFAQSEREELREKNIRVVPIGDLSSLPSDTQESITRLAEDTQAGDRLTLMVAINYGGRAELVQATRDIAQAAAAGDIDPMGVDEEVLAAHLYTHPYPDPDLLIRSGGEWRLSNFLLFQLAYAEIYCTDTLWPDFGPEQLHQALAAYRHRKRRFGAAPSDER